MFCVTLYVLYYYPAVYASYRLYVNKRLYYGTDRLFFVERALGIDAHPERLLSPPSSGSAKLTFFFDYSSPWSYVGFERLKQLERDVAPIKLNIEWVPILLGALFKEIGAPNASSAGNKPLHLFVRAFL